MSSLSTWPSRPGGRNSLLQGYMHRHSTAFHLFLPDYSHLGKQSMSGVKTLIALLTTTHISLLCCFHAFLAVLLGRYPMILASLTSWGLQWMSDFTLIPSHSGLSGPPCRDTSDICLSSVASLSHGGRFHNPFLVPLTLKPEPHGQSCQVLLLAGTRTCPLSFNYIYISFMLLKLSFTA